MDSQKAQELYERRKEHINNFLKFGSPLEKALAQAVVDAAGVKV